MGEKNNQFRLGRTYAFWIRVGLSALYLAWAVVFIVLGTAPRFTGAASGVVLDIPSISLSTNVQFVEPIERRFPVPEAAVGVYQPSTNKVFIMGHRATIFANLGNVKIGDEITYDEKTYRVSSRVVLPKDDIDMAEILSETSSPTLVLMTCAGQRLTDTDFSHRLIITAI
jgi:LPXTG-site transpeptidase (sortase) family protein